ncbi:MAG: carbohydrate ABC transporter substrate-binding protein, partial [Blautia coccoides]
MKMKKIMSAGVLIMMSLSLAACGNNEEKKEKEPENIPTIDSITLGEDHKDLTASIKVLTNRTDIVDTVYKGYAEEFMKLYPNIKVTYEGVTDYEESLTLRLTTGDWGDLCFIPTSVSKSELSDYFTPLGDADTLDKIYNFIPEKSYGGEVYGIANGGT